MSKSKCLVFEHVTCSSWLSVVVVVVGVVVIVAVAVAVAVVSKVSCLRACDVFFMAVRSSSSGRSSSRSRSSSSSSSSV